MSFKTGLEIIKSFVLVVPELSKIPTALATSKSPAVDLCRTSENHAGKSIRRANRLHISGQW
jgi:hypothetical protein